MLRQKNWRVTLLAGAVLLAVQLAAPTPASAQHSANHGIREYLVPGVGADFDATYNICQEEINCVTRDVLFGPIRGKLHAGARVILTFPGLQWIINDGHNAFWYGKALALSIGVTDSSPTTNIYCSASSKRYSGAALVSAGSDNDTSAGSSGDQFLNLNPTANDAWTTITFCYVHEFEAINYFVLQREGY